MSVSQVHVSESGVVVNMGDVDIKFFQPTEAGREELQINIVGAGETIRGTINSKTLMGALKALDTSHERRSINKRAEERWKKSID